MTIVVKGGIRGSILTPGKRGVAPGQPNSGGPGGGKGKGKGGGGSGSGTPLFIKVGSYTGDGVDGKTITTPFTPQFVLVKRVNGNDSPWLRTSDMVGDAAKIMNGSTAFSTNRIQSIITNGFTLGNDNAVNQLTGSYVYVIIKEGPVPIFKVGTYVGDGLNDRQVTVGFRPDNVFVFGGSSTSVIWRTSDFDANESCTVNGISLTVSIRNFNNTGFTVGTGASVNTAAATYYYIAFKNHPNAHSTNAWSGDGSDPRTISFGMSPGWVGMKRYNSTTVGVQRFSSGPAGDITQFMDGSVEAANMIQLLTSTGVQLGSATEVNAAGSIYKGFALRATVG